MEKNKIASLKRSFDEIAHTHVDNSDSVEYWFARELQQLLGYSRWEDFDKAVQRGITACENTGVPVENHFREVPKMVRLGSGSQREVRDYMLTRYACYLIAQNGDNRSVRQMLGERGIRPEELPPAEDIKKLERRVKSAEKKLVAESGGLPAAESTGDHE